MDFEKISNLIKTSNRPKELISKIHDSTEEDYYKIKESLLKRINDEFGEAIISIKSQLEQCVKLKDIYTEQGNTSEVNEFVGHINHLNKTLVEVEASKQKSIIKVSNIIDPIIKIEYETTAFYSEINYAGDEYLVTGNSSNADVNFYLGSIRVARGRNIKIYPHKNYKSDHTHRNRAFSVSTPSNLGYNVNTGSMISNPRVLRATSWRIT
jgi:hypothetical protein